MDYQELLFAAEVRRLALDIRQAHRTKYYNSFSEELRNDRKKRDELMEKWGEENKVEKFLQEAFNRIAGVAQQLGTLREEWTRKQLDGNKFAQAAQQSPANSSETAKPAE